MFSTDGTLISASAAPHCGVFEEELDDDEETVGEITSS